MSFQIELDKYERAYGRLLHKIQTSIQQTFAEEEEERGLTQSDIARELKVDKASISRRLNGAGNITLRTISDLFTAMDREPLSNFSANGSFCQYSVGGPQTVNINFPVTEAHYYMCLPMPQTLYSVCQSPPNPRKPHYEGLVKGSQSAGGLFPRSNAQAVAACLGTTTVGKEYLYNG